MAAMALLPCHTVRLGTAALGRVKMWSRRRASGAFSSLPPAAAAKEPLLLKSSQFAHLFEEGPTERAYAGTVLRDLTQYEQGKVMQEWARDKLRELNPEAQILDPDPGTNCIGRSRSVYNAPYDFILNGRRVEVKSARMVWHPVGESGEWILRFGKVKIPLAPGSKAAFDDLYLVVLSPARVHLIKHDLRTGIHLDGERTDALGHKLQVTARRHGMCWKDELKTILLKLSNAGCPSIASESLLDSDLKDKLLKHRNLSCPVEGAYLGIPLHHFSKEKRALRIQKMGFIVDGKLNPRSHFGPLEASANAAADWVRDTVRVEIKTSKLNFHRSSSRWFCYFTNIKPAFFDELWLAIYSPKGIHIYKSKCAESLGLSTSGVATPYNGLTARFYGPANEADPLKVVKAIEAKMIERGCEQIAMVQWD